MNLLAECGKREQELRIIKEELIKKYSFNVDSKVMDLLNKGYGALSKRLMTEWSDRRNLSIITDLLDKYERLNTIFQTEGTFPDTDDAITEITNLIFPKKAQVVDKKIVAEISECNSIAEILQYKNTAQITKMLNNTDSSLTKFKPYSGLGKDETINILKSIYSVCTQEKKKLIDKFLGGK